ncbi:MAG: substrate-binding domain-containing protein [Bryobacteraceae bacterium]|nr:substrate-binding domain-containing protein [Bryobacteraceae bacterium]
MTDLTLLTRRQALLPLLTIPAFTGCNRNEKKRIGVVAKGRSHVFWQSVHAGAVKAAQESNVEVEWNAPPTEAEIATQIQIVEAMINKHLDAIALAPIDKAALVSVVERAGKAGIPIVIFDSGIDTENFVSQIATDNYKAGELGAQRIIEITGGKGPIAIVAVSAGAASTMAREAGFEDYIRKNAPGISVVDKRYGDAEVSKSLRVSENMLTAHPEIVAFFASNESSTTGASQALKGRGRKVKLVGFDSGPQLEGDLRAGIIDSLVVQNPFLMGYESVMAAVRHMKGEKTEKIQNLAARLITRDNIDNPDVQRQLNPDLKKYLG